MKNFSLSLSNSKENRKLNVVETEDHYTWIINSTGSNTVGTSFSPDLEQYLLSLGFVKIFKGSPMYATTKGYTEEQIRAICSSIMNGRVYYGQKVEKIQCTYMPGSYLRNLKFDSPNV